MLFNKKCSDLNGTNTMSEIRRARRTIKDLGIIPMDEQETDGLLALIGAYEGVKTTRLAVLEAQEDALLELALWVQHYKHSFSLSWRELNRAFGFPHADTAIYRLLNRSGEITDRTYGKIASGLNKALEDMGEQPFEARVWVNWKASF